MDLVSTACQATIQTPLTVWWHWYMSFTFFSFIYHSVKLYVPHWGSFVYLLNRAVPNEMLESLPLLLITGQAIHIMEGRWLRKGLTQHLSLPHWVQNGSVLPGGQAKYSSTWDHKFSFRAGANWAARTALESAPSPVEGEKGAEINFLLAESACLPAQGGQSTGWQPACSLFLVALMTKPPCFQGTMHIPRVPPPTTAA